MVTTEEKLKEAIKLRDQYRALAAREVLRLRQNLEDLTERIRAIDEQRGDIVTGVSGEDGHD